MSANETFTLKAFCCLKVNAVHSMYNYVHGVPTFQHVQQMSVVMFSERDEGFERKGCPFF